MWPRTWQRKGLRCSECDSQYCHNWSITRELSSQILCDVCSEIWRCWIMLVVRLRSYSQRNGLWEGWQFILQNSGINVTYWILWESSRSPVTPHSMFIEIWIWNLLSVVLFGLPWSHKWEPLVLLTLLQVNVLLFWTKCSNSNGGVQLTSGIQLPTHVCRWCSWICWIWYD
jgi:hypothetical protein